MAFSRRKKATKDKTIEQVFSQELLIDEEQASEASSDKATITKKQLVLSIAADCHLAPFDVRGVVQAFLNKILEALAEGRRLEFRDFGVFEVVLRKKKIGRNPRKADEAIVIPERYAVKFTAGKKMKKKIEKTL